MNTIKQLLTLARDFTPVLAQLDSINDREVEDLSLADILALAGSVYALRDPNELPAQQVVLEPVPLPAIAASETPEVVHILPPAEPTEDETLVVDTEIDPVDDATLEAIEPVAELPTKARRKSPSPEVAKSR